MDREQHSGGTRGTELGRFLRACRARLAPEEVGLVAGGGRRRTPGLRREELATLAGISIDYYARLERGTETRPSPSVIDSLGRALKLEDDERDHLRALAALAARSVPQSPSAPNRTVRPGVKLLLESLRPFPAHVFSRTGDVLAYNPGGLRLVAGLDDWPAEQRNIARYVFLHPGARVLFDDWDNQVRSCVNGLRALAGMEPDAPDLTQLVGELLLKSPEFARLWERYDVKGHTYGRKTFHHPEVGDLTLGYQTLQLQGSPANCMVVYYAEPGTPEHDALALLDLAADESEHAPRLPPNRQPIEKP
ncbi:helix-turn-helix transcriptional regulator [Streptomyces sp. NPDC058694]|uniref:helix-turn-helix transcriptional regulator n=1 Tax=Streptomyces sp. NPDC058694 TaxID=3346603 RepID=UPI00364A9CCD